MQESSVSKTLHTNNVHNNGYDFAALIKSLPALKIFVKPNKYGNESIDFADPHAVKTLNQALLKYHYGIVGWDIPQGFLCPPIPGRVDYIHYITDLLNADNNSSINLLDIGTGANGIYALLACKIYGWQCTASDIDPISLENVAKIVSKNSALEKQLTLRLQANKNHIFEGIIQAGEYFDVSMCNPPFHASLEEALRGNQKKRKNLALNRKEKLNKTLTPALNFGGQKAELWCNGGEMMFLRTMIKESKTFSHQCRWFTSLTSKSDNLKPAKKLLQKLEASEIKEIEMKQGNKITRILAWSFSSNQ